VKCIVKYKVTTGHIPKELKHNKGLQLISNNINQLTIMIAYIFTYGK